MSDQNRSINPFLPFVLGMLIMAGAGGVWYFFTQRQSGLNAVRQTDTTFSLSSSPDASSPQVTPTASQPSLTTANPFPAPLSLNQQINHPNGSTARLTQLTFHEDSAVADLTVTNGYREEIRLNGSNDMVLMDNFDNQYNLAIPSDNKTIVIAPNSTLEGQFVFKGRLAPNVTEVRLITNNGSSDGGQSKVESSPTFVFTVPLQGSPK
jgi:hypothetical protein